MENWREILRQSLTNARQLAEHLPIDTARVSSVAARYPFCINPYYFSLIETKDDAIWRQVVPNAAELTDEVGVPDPLAEEPLSPVSNLIHRYPDRVVLLVSNECAAYCRFCMRKRRVGLPLPAFTDSVLFDVIDYLRREPRVRDVILSGGDPLLLETDALERILSALRKIAHIEVIRIHTRTPCTLPQRITHRLVSMLKQFHPLYVNTHFNHPREITPEAAVACARLADAGMPLGNQTVLLKGVNDDAIIMKQLFQQLLKLRVRPYYLHHPDLVRGTGHFRVPIQKGLEIMSLIQGHTSGLCMPHYVIDVPGGGGKVPLLSEYVKGVSQSRLTVETYSGKQFEYPVD
ncbi:MAG: KamA family radical SAM protein [Desulfobacterales bacterium]|jgi:lysine 2,3-aminomutase|nr:KamA family radical SAM protein [Desulfobacterales bacterium]